MEAKELREGQLMASKHLWIAELQDRDGKAVEYHSIELEEAHYPSKADFNRAMTSWSAFRQRERANLKCNRPRNSRCKWACSWMTPDSITFYVDGVPEMPLHKTIWDLYDAIGYNYKAKKYERQTVIAIDPGAAETNIAEVTFGKGIPLKVRQITSNHGGTVIVQDQGLHDMSEEPKPMRGHNPHIMHLDASGFLNEDGKQVYVATGNGECSTFTLADNGGLIPEKIGVVTAGANAEFPTICERTANGAGMVAEPATIEEVNRLRALNGLPPCAVQPAEPEGDEGEAGALGVEGEPGIEDNTEYPGDDTVYEAEYPQIKNPYNGINITAAQARAIADAVNAEPDIDAKKRILDAELQSFAAEREGRLQKETVLDPFRQAQARKNSPAVIAHKKAVVKSHMKLKRQQAKAEKLKALQVKAFNGK